MSALEWMPASVALQSRPDDGEFESVPYRSLAWPIDDIGVTHGAILVERLRTMGGRIVYVDEKRSRLARAAEYLGIRLAFDERSFGPLCTRLLEDNRSIVEQLPDVGIVILVSPGICMLHLAPIDFAKLARWYRGGAALVVSEQTPIPSSCWPHWLKTRNRLHYWMADRAAAHRRSDALGLLRSSRGTMADTSIANILVVDAEGTIASPKRQDMFPGSSLTIAEQLLKGLGYTFEYRDIPENELRDASEVMMTGSTGCVWPVGWIDGVEFLVGPIYRALVSAWIDRIEFNFVEQANSVEG